jgi:acetyl esterase/lipase
MSGSTWLVCAWVFAAAGLLRPGSAGAQALEVETRRDVRYATHDGVALAGDYYVAKAPGKYPVIVAVHGGGWQGGTQAGYRYWGPYLAARGIALYSVAYRLSKPGQPTFPQAVHDVRAAIQYVKHNAADLKADPERVGLMGDSAGAHLAALVGLAGDAPIFAKGYPSDPYASVSTHVKTVVAAYGVYDLLAQWQHDQIARPRDQIAEKFVGKPPMDDRQIYFDGSPISYAVRGDAQPSFFLTWGSADDVVDPTTQSEAFLVALKQAGIVVRTGPIPGAPHFYLSEPIDEPHSIVATVMPRILRFLKERL